MKTYSVVLAGLVIAASAAPALSDQTKKTTEHAQKTQTQSNDAANKTNTTGAASTQARGGFDTPPKAAPAVQGSTGTVTAQQAIDNYKKSGAADPGAGQKSKLLKDTKPVP